MTIKLFEKLSSNYIKLLENGDDFIVIIEVGKSPVIKEFKAHSAILNPAYELLFEELAEILETYLIESMAYWIHSNITQVYKTSFQNNRLKKLQQCSLIKRDDLQLEEIKIWKLIIKWGIAQNPNLPSDLENWSDENFMTLKVTLKNFLPFIRYFQISSEDVANYIMPYSQILEKKLWNDLAKKFMVPNYQVTSVIIPPRIILKQELLTMPTEILKCQRKEAHEYFKRGKFLKALELYEEILENCQHNAEDQKNASTWDFSYIKCENLNELMKALYKNTKLTSLNLYANYCGSEVGKILADVLCKSTTLTSLDLSFNKLGLEVGKALADALCKNTTLTSLNLYHNCLGSEGVKVLADSLCKNTMLTFLNLGCTELGSEGVNALANALCKNTALTSLNLSTLAYLLCKITTLTSLDLNNNNLKNQKAEGGKALADALCKNTTLTSLYLQCNNSLGSEELKALADALCKNTTLTSSSLKLCNNKLGSEERVKALADALCKNTTLTSLNLCNNELGSEGGKALANVLYKNTTLTSLNLGNNNINFKLKSNNHNIRIFQ
ncbi:hypothetical protein C2G38_2178647 [Gigaspora rosea]|uniref:BTB domain-containing protein n=1 Tax=Gigaspora rosea TaxID=44941 RepID=A0A397VFS6_9GLOM|nr:hypothetical protein C2G38_2178647 [Gigaspora rosea]